MTRADIVKVYLLTQCCGLEATTEVIFLSAGRAGAMAAIGEIAVQREQDKHNKWCRDIDRHSWQQPFSIYSYRVSEMEVIE